MTDATETDPARFYAACLASYNSGVLYGRWIDADSDVDTMQAAVAEMLRGSKFPNVTVTHPETGEQVPSAEEWAIHDSEGLPSTFGEYSGLQPIADFMALVDDYPHIESDDLAAIVDNFHSVDAAESALADNFAGIWDSFRDYADEQADEMMQSHGPGVPDVVSRYFDYASFARDLALEMTVIEISGGQVAIFYA